MTTGLKTTLAEHAAGNYRVLMNMADELLCFAAEKEIPRLDEKLFFDVFQPPAPKKARQGQDGPALGSRTRPPIAPGPGISINKRAQTTIKKRAHTQESSADGSHIDSAWHRRAAEREMSGPSALITGNKPNSFQRRALRCGWASEISEKVWQRRGPC